MMRTPVSQLRRRLLAAGLTAFITAPTPHAQNVQPVAAALEDVYRPGLMLRDRNGDDVVDFVAARLVLGESPSLDEVTAGADVAARFGFETMAMDLPVSRTGAGGLLVAIGPAGVARAGIDLSPVYAGTLTAGQGLIAMIEHQGQPTVIVTGGDGAGTRAAATTFAGRLPYVWTPKGATLQQVTDDVRAVLNRAGITAAGVGTVAVRVDAEQDELARVIVRAQLASSSEATRARAALNSVRTMVAKDSLSYPGAASLEVRLIAGTAAPAPVVMARASVPAPDDGPLPRRPGAGAKDAIDLSNLFAIEGLLGDSDNNLIADRLDAIISPASADADGVIDLAARLGLESSGMSWPVAIPANLLTRPESHPTLVLVGSSHPIAAELAKSGKLTLPALQPGQGAIQIVRKAFGEKAAVVVTGADAPGLRRALQQMAERFPHVWQRGKDRTTLDDVEEDVRRFVGGRSPAGQAAGALYKLDRLVERLRGRALESASVRVYVEKAATGLDDVVRRRVQSALTTDRLDVTVENLDVQQAAPLIEEEIEIPSEVDEFWQAFRKEVLPRVRRGQPVIVEARLSEPPEIRDRIARDATDALLKAGARQDGTSVVVLSAYKQGYSWLYDVVRPALAGKPVRDITIRFAETGPPEEWKQQAMFTPTRWLLEIFPIDEVLARDLKLDLSKITLEKMPIGSPTYEVIATATDGTELLRERFDPKYVLRPYFDRFPDYEKVRVTTGWLSARSGGQVLTDRRIVTDLEHFWDHFQAKTLSPMYDYVMRLEEGKPRAERAPFFGELTVDVSLSEPNYMIGVDKEQIASLNSLHEDIYFGTLHFFDVLGRYATGRPLNYPGRVIPVMRPKGDGRVGRAKIRLTGFGSSRPQVVIDFVEKGGTKGTLELDVPKIDVERPSARAAIVREGRDGLESLALHVKVDSNRDERDTLVLRAREERVDAQIISAEQTGAVLANLAMLREAGLYRDALSYHDVGAMQVVAHWTYEPTADSQQVFTLDSNGTPAPFPDIRRLLPAGYRHGGEPLVQWDTPIPPPEANAILAKMSATFPQATAYKVGESYLGKEIWAMDVMPPIEATHWSMAKASTLKPTVVYSARQHANEVSSTSHTLKLAELLLTNPEFREKLNKVNVVFHPITNPDGAQLAYDLYRITPDYMLHAGYLGSLGVDVTSGQWEQDPIYPESTIRADIWRDWRPDIFLNPHGYPSHEWVMLFSEYAGWVRNRVTEARDWWGMRGWFTPGFNFVDDPKFPRHKDAAFEIRDRFSRAINEAADVRALNERGYARYRRYGHAFDPENFKLDFTNGVLIYTAIKGSKQSASSSDFMSRNPNVTIWTGSTEAPDETAYGDWMKLVATAGLEWDKAILDYLVDGRHHIERKGDPFHGGISLSVHRPRPPKPPDTKAMETTAAPGGQP
jgi:hypothetical protein